MSPRGQSVVTIDEDGVRNVRWVPETAPAKDDRLASAARIARDAFPKKERAALDALGVLHKFDEYHWQVRRDGKVTLDFWMKNTARFSWRWPNGPTRKGSRKEFFAEVRSRKGSP